MNWKHEARAKLLDYERRRRSLGSIAQEIKQLETECVSLHTGVRSAVPVHGEGSSREDAVLTNIVRREELARQLESARVWVALVDGGLGSLDDEDRLVLDRFYIHRQRNAVGQLCELLHCERTTVYRRRDEALRRFTLALYGGVES